MIVAIQNGLVYALLALGVYITFRILNIPDLTADGSFTFGMAVSAVFTLKEMPELGLLLAVFAGAAAGCVTGLLQTKAGIHPVLAGILTMFGLQSINLFVMGTPSLSLLNNITVFERIGNVFPFMSNNVLRTLVLAVFAVAAIIILQWFFSTQLGLSIRATGSNPDMVRASSINVDLVKIIGFALANALVALSGALLAQYQRNVDISAGIGTVTIGMASLIMGEVLCIVVELLYGKKSVLLGLIAALVGAIGYRTILQIIINYDIFPQYAFKLISAIIIGLALSVPAIIKSIRLLVTKNKAKQKNQEEIINSVRGR